MNLKSIKIGKLHTENNVFLAPLAGYTNAVFREMCYGLGAGLTFTEMVSAKGLYYGSEKTRELLHVTDGYGGIKACQIFGNDPEIMRQACESEALKDFDLVDINMGCPMPKIYNNGEGSALLNDLPLAGKIISACKKSGKAVSVKFRIGLDENRLVSSEFARMCEDSGADMICVHGRTRDKIYAGAVDYNEIAAAKNAVKIPVIANGGVFGSSDAEKLMAKTGADGVAVARGAMFAPWIFAKICGNPLPDKRQFVLTQLEKTEALYGGRFACVFMRKMCAFYLKSQKGCAQIRAKLFACPTCEELKELISALSF